MRGHITKRGSTWSIKVELERDPVTQRRRQKWYSGYRTKKEAQVDLAKIIHEIETGAYVEPLKLTVAAYLERWLESYAKPHVAPKTFERYAEVITHSLVPALGSCPLTKLRPLHVQSFYAEALEHGRKNGKGGLAPRTVVHYHRILREALQQAVRWQLLVRNPVDAVEPPRVEPKEMMALDETGTAWLLSAVRGTRLYVPVVLAISAGPRRGEIFGLRWRDIDFVAGTASIRQSLEQTNSGLRFKAPKTAKARRLVTLPTFTIEVLKEHRRMQERERKLFGPDYMDHDLVCALPDGSPWPPDTFSAEFRRFRDKCGLKIRFHDLRHSHASQLLRAGVHPKVVSERLGHSTVGITLDIYSHVLPGLQEQAAEKIDAVMRKADADSRSELMVIPRVANG